MWELKHNRPTFVQSGSDWTDFSGKFNKKGMDHHICANVFGYLTETASPILRLHHSDLYHDAILLQRRVADWDHQDTLTFWWGCRETGTQFLSERDATFEDYCDVFFECRLFPEERPWGTVFMFDMTRVK